MKRVTFSLLAGMVGISIWLAQPQAQSTVWFRASFETGAPTYGFAYIYPQDSNWRMTHLATGGWNGGGAAHVRMLAGRSQYGLGWVTPPNNRAFAMGDGVYIRFRIRYDDTYRFVGNAAKNKFMMFGSTSVTPQSRVILYQNAPSDSAGCTLGMRDWSRSGNPYFPWAVPSYYGLPNSTWDDSSIRHSYGSIAPHINISWACAPPALMSYGNNANTPAPGPNSARPTGGWYHFQVLIQSGQAGQSGFKMWVNNNSFSSPTSQAMGLSDVLGVIGWSGGLSVGGYVDDSPVADLGFRLDDLEYGPSFDSAWFPGSAPGPTPPPTSPTNLRIIR